VSELKRQERPARSSPPTRRGSRNASPTIPKTALFTIGYQEKTASDFVRLLLEHNVQTLVDIRATPMSRRAEFRQKALAKILADAGIAYRGMPSLGTPADIRDDLKASGDYGVFFRRFKKHMNRQTESLAELTALVRKKRCVLMCFERDAKLCHRSAVADYLKVKLSCGATDI